MNTTSNCVLLTHIPTGAFVKCQKTRYLEQNRKEARKRLLVKVDEIINPTCSLRLIATEKAIQKNHVKRAKSKKKYQLLEEQKKSSKDSLLNREESNELESEDNLNEREIE